MEKTYLDYEASEAQNAGEHEDDQEQVHHDHRVSQNGRGTVRLSRIGH